MIEVLDAIIAERQRQDEKWGEQNHVEPLWATILGEEFGEVCRASLAIEAVGLNDSALVEHLRSELIQVAAVAVAWVECLERNAE